MLPLYQLDGDGDGVLGREEWTKWWVQRWKANPPREGKNDGPSTGDDDSKGAGDRGTRSGGEGGSEKVSRLAERARQARRRASTDIHTAAWRGDLALVKVGVRVCAKGCFVPCCFGVEAGAVCMF